MAPARARPPVEAGGPPPATDGLRIAFLDSWARSRARGSGSAVAIDGLAGGLEALGHRVRRVEPGADGGRTLTRIAFNASLPFRFRGDADDLVVGFDLDGCFLPPGPTPRVAALKGILADEKRFERGGTRLRFEALSRLEGRAARTADRVVVTSRYCRSVAVEAYGLDAGSVAVVPEGIDPGPWEEVAERRRRHRRDGSRRVGGEDGPVVLSVARQYPRKNTETLLRAFPRVRAEVPGARLRVVGGGPRLPALRRLARRLGLGDAARLPGEVEDLEALRAEYARADVFCLPSLQEGFGIVFLEAMASGLPVVAGDTAAVPEVVPDGEAGILVPPRRAGELAASLVRLLEDPALRRGMGAAGRRHARRFAWPEVARRFLDAAPTAERPSVG